MGMQVKFGNQNRNINIVGTTPNYADVNRYKLMYGRMFTAAENEAKQITAKNMQEKKLDPEIASTLLIYAMLGGLIGSKLYYAIDVGIRTGAPFSDLFFARAGITWYGGLMGGILACYIGARNNQTCIKMR